MPKTRTQAMPNSEIWLPQEPEDILEVEADPRNSDWQTKFYPV